MIWRNTSNAPVKNDLQPIPVYKPQCTAPHKWCLMPPYDHGDKSNSRPTVNLLVGSEAKRNLLFSFVSYHSSCSLVSPCFSSLTFPAIFVWLRAHLTSIKTSTLRSRGCIGAGWKSSFFFLFVPYFFFSFRQRPNWVFRIERSICLTVKS